MQKTCCPHYLMPFTPLQKKSPKRAGCFFFADLNYCQNHFMRCKTKTKKQTKKKSFPFQLYSSLNT